MAEITVVGGINIDIEGVPFRKLKYQDSNPGQIRLSYGGVGRNIAENIARLGGDCAMLSVIAGDGMSCGALEHLRALGVDVSRVIRAEDGRPSMYLSILDEKRDMEIGLSDMEIIDRITPEVIDEAREFLTASKAVALDGNLTEKLLGHATSVLSETKRFYDPVSANKAVRARDFIGRFTAIKPNRMEAEALLGMGIESEADIERAAERFLSLGVKQVFITLNREGVYYRDEAGRGFLRPEKDLIIRSATGAGDSFSACILMGMARDWEAEKIARMGMKAAAITMESREAVNPAISMEEIRKRG